ncbi:hypothetical protein [Roseivivax sp.]
MAAGELATGGPPRPARVTQRDAGATPAPSLTAFLPPRFIADPRNIAPPQPEPGALRFALPARARPGARVALRMGESWQPGHRNMFGFEILIEPETLPRQTPLTLARWQAGPEGPVLLEMTLDARHGLLVENRRCVGPAGFGTWRRVYLRILWSKAPSGYLEVRCGTGALATMPVIYAREGIATHPPGAPPRYDLSLGLIAGRTLAAPAEVRLRRIIWRRLYVVFDRVAQAG